MEFGNRPGRRIADLIGAVALLAVVFFAGMTATLMIGFFGAPGGASSECTGPCRTYADAGAGLMAYGTYVVMLVVLVLIVRSWWLERPILVWPLRAIPLLAVLAIVGFLLATYGAASNP